MKPIVVIHKAIDFMSGRLEFFTDIGSRTIMPETMKKCPSSNFFLSRNQMSMKIASIEKPPVHRYHVAVNHIAGSMGIWILNC